MIQLTAEQIGRALGGRRVGTTIMARCPAHDDRNPSLSLKDAGGKLLLYCFAGCDPRDILEKLKVLGLLQGPVAAPHEKPTIVGTYDYTDERGELLYQIVRFEPGHRGEKKTFSQRYPDGRGGWNWKKHPRQVLYHLPELIEAPIVFVVEGEKDVETLREHGFVATSNAGGCRAPWLPSFTQALAGREVVIIPDNDPPGRLRALRIAREITGHASRVVILELDGAKDVSEWFERGHSETGLIALLDDPEAVSA